jgi:hypothetical protein
MNPKTVTVLSVKDMPFELIRAARHRALDEGISLKAILIRALEREMAPPVPCPCEERNTPLPPNRSFTRKKEKAR